MNLLQLLLVHDPAVYTKGWVVTISGFCIVILALYLLSLIFRGVASYFIKHEKKAHTQKVKTNVEEMHPAAKPAEGIPAEVITAIGMALYLATNLHDEESEVITIEKRNTSWNSKNYGVRHWNF